jgi:DNA-binding transcriptional MerR regulator
MSATTVTIPNRPVFRAQEVCELAELQPYVLRTWEAEFPELGVAKTPTSPRVYRRVDVERVLRIKHLLFVDGLTLAGARRRLTEEGFGPAGAAGEASDVDADVAALIDSETRQQLRDVRRGLQWILGVLSGEGLTPTDFVLRAESVHVGSAARGNKVARSTSKGTATASRASARPPSPSGRPVRPSGRKTARGKKR